MHNIKPVLTEKGINDAKEGKYTFWVETHLTKFGIKKQISEIFGVTVNKVRTINYKGRIKKNYLGKKRRIKARKKAIVTISGKDKIDIFETKK